MTFYPKPCSNFDVTRSGFCLQVLGTPIARVQARDADAQAPHNVIQYFLVGDALAQQYFMVNAETGEVAVRKDLGDDDNTRYSVGS